MRITSEMLTEADACDNQAAIFAAEWPDGCEVTPEVAQRAVALGLDLNWAAEHLLPKTALAAYEAARATAWATYQAARAPALAAYEAVAAPAFVEACGIADEERSQNETIGFPLVSKNDQIDLT